jgi:elongation factor G
MERYLDGQEIAHDEIVEALKAGTNHGSLFPVTCGVPTRNIGTDRLLDAIVDDLPSPVLHGPLDLGDVVLEPDPDRELFAYVFKTKADPFAGRVNWFRVYQGTLRPDVQVMNTRTHHKERLGQVPAPLGPGRPRAGGQAQGDAGGRLARRARRADHDAEHRAARRPSWRSPSPRRPRGTRRSSSRRSSACRRRTRRSTCTATRRRARRSSRGCRRSTSRWRWTGCARGSASRWSCARRGCPTARRSASRRRPTGATRSRRAAAGQFGDCHITIEPLEGEDFEFVDEIKGGVIPGSFIPAVARGCEDALAHGALGGFPVRGVRVRLFDGSSHSVDSSEHAFRAAGTLAMREALEKADPVLLEPIMTVTLTVPESAVGDVIGDLNGRRGRPQGMEPVGRDDAGRAEVPMAELLTYAPDLRALTAGQGDYTMEFARYEEVPGHLAAKVIKQAEATAV